MAAGLRLDNVEHHITLCKELRDHIAAQVGRVLYPYQVGPSDRIIEAQLRMEGDELFILQARQSGKTEEVVLALLALCVYFVSKLKLNYEIGIFAPAQSQTIDVVRKRLTQRFDELEPFFRRFGVTSYLGKGRTTRLFFIVNVKDGKEARMRCMSSDTHAQIKGESLHLILIEQAEDADEEKLKNDIFPMGAATGGVRVLSGTSTSEIVNTYYYNGVLTGVEGEDLFVIDCYEAAKYNPTYAAYIKKEKERYGPGSPAFAAQYELKWGLVSNKFILDREAFLALEESDYEPSGGLYRIRQDQGLRRTAAWDPARGGDYSWVTVIEGTVVKHIIDFWISQGVNLETQALDVGEWLRERGVSRLGVGVIGLGQGPADIFENHFPDIELVRINEDAATQDKMFKHEEQEIANKRVRYPSEAVWVTSQEGWKHRLFLEHILDAERKYRGNKLQVVAPKGKSRHDDANDSLAMVLYIHDTPVFEMGVEIVDFLL